ncbi:TadE/TadG family type IV pilus assembly protein [Novipirellula sp. SH528]|uniref:TadE/TadG family type IV pilus assembly protein n=1 Tax=Novipirellula sp. SH528 TaxID=3454466 RepID=UPI003F9ECEF7
MQDFFKALLRRFWYDDQGASYSISVVLMIPILIGVVCLSIETALLLISKQALNTASQSAMHVAQAWVGHQDSLHQNGESLETVVHQAVARTLVPFASARADQSHETSGDLQSIVTELGLPKIASDRLSQKNASFEKITRVMLSRSDRSTPGWLARIEFDVPLWTPFVSKLYQTTVNADGHPARTIATEVWIPMSQIDAERTEIGIPYSPRKSADWPE